MFSKAIKLRIKLSLYNPTNKIKIYNYENNDLI